MRHIHYSSEFKKDFKRAARGIYRNLLVKDGEFDKVKFLLANDIPLPPKYRDHPLHNNLEGKRECHLRPDFLLLYSYEGSDFLVLEGLGTHSHLLGL